MASIDEIRVRLNNYITEKGFTYREVSLKIGRKDSYIQQYIKYGFPKRLYEMDRKKIASLLEIDEKELIDDDLLLMSSKDKSIGGEAFVLDNFSSINIYGEDKGDFENKVIGSFCINADEFKGFGFDNLDGIKIFRQIGDSMKPTINDLGLVVFDSRINYYLGDGIYVIKHNNRLMVKRVQKRFHDRYVIISDNKIYHEIWCEDSEVEFLGRALSVIENKKL